MRRSFQAIAEIRGSGDARVHSPVKYPYPVYPLTQRLSTPALRRGPRSRGAAHERLRFSESGAVCLFQPNARARRLGRLPIPDAAIAATKQ